MVVQKQPLSFYVFISVTFFFAFLFEIFPFGDGIAQFRPSLICLLIIYWVIRATMYFGVATSACMGLFHDMLVGSIWGAHMLALTVVTYVCMMSYQRINNYAVIHQAIWVFVLIGVYQLILSWFTRLKGYSPSALDLIIPPLVSAILWPFLVWGMFRLRRTFHIYVPH